MDDTWLTNLPNFDCCQSMNRQPIHTSVIQTSAICRCLNGLAVEYIIFYAPIKLLAGYGQNRIIVDDCLRGLHLFLVISPKNWPFDIGSLWCFITAAHQLNQVLHRLLQSYIVLLKIVHRQTINTPRLETFFYMIKPKIFSPDWKFDHVFLEFEFDCFIWSLTCLRK